MEEINFKGRGLESSTTLMVYENVEAPDTT
jgi:hypothetical protein